MMETAAREHIDPDSLRSRGPDRLSPLVSAVLLYQVT